MAEKKAKNPLKSALKKAVALGYNKEKDGAPKVLASGQGVIAENIIAAANENAKTVVVELLSATVQSVDPEYTVVVVQ